MMGEFEPKHRADVTPERRLAMVVAALLGACVAVAWIAMIFDAVH